jgi:hypothetical protein
MIFSHSYVNTLKIIKEIQLKHPVKSSFYQFSDWDDFLILSRNVKINDNLVIVLSRKGYSSYHNNMFKIPDYLNKYFTENNYFLVYPIQSGVGDDVSLTLSNPSVMEPFREIEELRKIITKLFKNK